VRKRRKLNQKRAGGPTILDPAAKGKKNVSQKKGATTCVGGGIIAPSGGGTHRGLRSGGKKKSSDQGEEKEGPSAGVRIRICGKMSWPRSSCKEKERFFPFAWWELAGGRRWLLILGLKRKKKKKKRKISFCAGQEKRIYAGQKKKCSPRVT